MNNHLMTMTTEGQEKLAVFVRSNIIRDLPKLLNDLLDYMGEHLEVLPVYNTEGKLHQYSVKFKSMGKETVVLYQLIEKDGVREIMPLMELLGHSN